MWVCIKYKTKQSVFNYVNWFINLFNTSLALLNYINNNENPIKWMFKGFYRKKMNINVYTKILYCTGTMNFLIYITTLFSMPSIKGGWLFTIQLFSNQVSYLFQSNLWYEQVYIRYSNTSNCSFASYPFRLLKNNTFLYILYQNILHVIWTFSIFTTLFSVFNLPRLLMITRRVHILQWHNVYFFIDLYVPTI